MDNIPCKNCIVLAICRSKLMDKRKEFELTNLGAINYLKKDCSLLRAYIIEAHDVMSAIRKHKEAAAYMVNYNE